MIHAYDKSYLSAAQKKSCPDVGLSCQRSALSVGDGMAVVCDQ